MDEIHVHKTKKSICAHFAESPCRSSLLAKTVNSVAAFTRKNCSASDQT